MMDDSCFQRRWNPVSKIIKLIYEGKTPLGGQQLQFGVFGGFFCDAIELLFLATFIKKSKHIKGASVPPVSSGFGRSCQKGRSGPSM